MIVCIIRKYAMQASPGRLVNAKRVDDAGEAGCLDISEQCRMKEKNE